MFNVVLVEPEIPPNTGNIIRLCANSGCSLHLIHPLGFSLQEKQLRRAGLDYADMARVTEYGSFAEFVSKAGTSSTDSVSSVANQLQPVAFSTKGKTAFHKHAFKAGEWMLFGSETRGLADEILDDISPERLLRIPMLSENRSMNLSNTVAIAVYEAWRQLDFAMPDQVFRP